jgi:hypothetical protein
MVAWWWIPAAFGIAIVGGALLMLIVNIKSLIRYIKIRSM